MPVGATTAERGIALILVLWVIALLTVIALAVVSTSRTEVNLVHNRLDEARIRALAEAGMAIAVLRLSSREMEDQWLPDGSPNRWNFAGQELEIRIFNESSSIDINKVQENILVELIAVLQLEDVDAEAIVAAVRDWRDADDNVQPGGAEDADYLDAGLPYGAKDGNFDSTGEIGQVLGVSRELLRLLEPHLTVDSPTARIMSEYASPLVRAAMGEEELENAPLSAGQVEDGRQRRNLGGPVYRIRVSSVNGGPAVETLVRLGSGSFGVASVLWRRYAWHSESPAETQ